MNSSGTKELRLGNEYDNDITFHISAAAGENNPAMIIKRTSGNVGMGTPSPGYPLDVAGTIRARDVFGAGGQNLIIGDDTYLTDTDQANLLGVYGTQNPDRAGIRLGSDGSFIFGDNGNVGVGTTIPGYKLTVAGDIYANGGWLRTSGNQGWYSESYGGGWFMEDSSWIRTYNAKSVWTSGGLLGSQGGLTIGYAGATPPSGGAIIAGNVGIGTPAPAAKLDVAGTDVFGLRYIKSGSKDARIGIGDPTKTWSWAVGWAGPGDLSLIEEGIAGDRIYVKQGGNVGIGRVNPFAKLHVAGNLIIGIGPGYLPPPEGASIIGGVYIGAPGIPSDLKVAGSIHYYGDIFDDSDTRIKVDQRQLEYGLTEVMALNPKRYNQAEWGINPETKELIIYPDRISKTNEIGIVAQEAQQVIPEAVNVPVDETRQTWGLNYIKLIPVLIKAIQEQQALIEEQKGINAAQEAKIKSLEERIAALEQK